MAESSRAGRDRRRQHRRGDEHARLLQEQHQAAVAHRLEYRRRRRTHPVREPAGPTRRAPADLWHEDDARLLHPHALPWAARRLWALLRRFVR